jgi:hypothetical protein
MSQSYIPENLWDLELGSRAQKFFYQRTPNHFIKKSAAGGA